MTIKKRKVLPNTIKLTRAWAGEKRSYSEDQIKKIADHLGPLSKGEILYPGCISPLHILGEDHPEMIGMFQAHLRRDGQVKMSRELALLSCLETAAWQYKSNKQEKKKKGDTPSQKLKTLVKLRKACDALMDGGGLYDTLGVSWRRSTLEEDVHKALIPLKEEIQYQEKFFSRQKAPSRSRHRRNTALHDLIAELCVIWVNVAGQKLSTGSVSPHDKKVGGPLIRFIDSALVPLKITKTPNAIRELLRDVKSDPKYKKLI